MKHKVSFDIWGGRTAPNSFISKINIFVGNYSMKFRILGDGEAASALEATLLIIVNQNFILLYDLQFTI